MATHTTGTVPHKYKPLTEFLRRQSRAVVRMSFEEIEGVIGTTLPPSATRHRAWWSNNPDNNVMTRAWKDAGFDSEDVDMKRRRVAFRRVRSDSSYDTGGPAAGVTTGDRHPLLGCLKGTLTIAEGVDLAQPADPEWGEVAYADHPWADRK